MSEIKITVDMAKKAITGAEIPEDMQKNPVELALIFNQLAVRMLSGIKIEPASKIIKPKMKIVGGK
jgi:hypothetical protein